MNLSITVSISVVVPDVADKSIAVDDLLVAVDEALYAAKDGGHNRVALI